MKRHIFILIPSIIPSGPVKGAIALANALSCNRSVTLVSLKGGGHAQAKLFKGVRYVSLSTTYGGISGKIKIYRQMLKEAGGRQRVASISLCFSADVVNLFCKNMAIVCSSVRGNLLKNYMLDYGVAGLGFALGHLVALNRFDHVVVMTKAMANQVRPFLFRCPEVIGNFVDEKALNGHKTTVVCDGIPRFVFLGSLTKRKQPLIIVNSVALLRDRGLNLKLDIIGQGPLETKILSEIKRLGLQGMVHMHGQLENPYDLLAGANALVLPSLSEGISRAALEALHLGVPCLLRNVDGNSELIINRYNGLLFDTDDELPDAMLEIAKLKNDSNDVQQSLIPEGFRQMQAADRYLELIE